MRLTGAPSRELTGELIGELAEALGPAGCLGPGRVPEAARSDASRTGRHLPCALLRPASTAEVSAALRICHHHGQPVVPQGGMTGLAGGANPRPEDVALSLSRLAGVEEIDERAGVMVVRAGTVLAVAQAAAEEAGLLLPVDLGARGSCQVGGIIATNAGGPRVIRHGMTRDNLLGLEVVLADGTVVSGLGRLVKNNTGYDLRHLFAGSEGTLGVITRAVLRLRPRPPAIATALCALRGYGDVMALLTRARRRLVLSAFEAMWRDYFRLNQQAAGLSLFADPPAMSVLVETETDGDAADLEAVLAEALAAGEIRDALIARSEADARRFWEVREGHALETILPDLVNLDVSLPLDRMDDFAAALHDAIKARHPGAEVLFFGHVGDNNLHVALSLPDVGEADRHAAEAMAYRLVRKLEGSISAEHGIGTLKRAWLGHSRSPEELELMRRIKASFDPAGLLNPGKLL